MVCVHAVLLVVLTKRQRMFERFSGVFKLNNEVAVLDREPVRNVTTGSSLEHAGCITVSFNTTEQIEATEPSS